MGVPCLKACDMGGGSLYDCQRGGSKEEVGAFLALHEIRPLIT